MRNGTRERSAKPAALGPAKCPRAVVTGAAGFIGSHLVDALLARGHEVVGIDAFTTYYSPSLKLSNIATASGHPRFHLLRAGLDQLALSEVLQSGDVVFHLAAQPGVRSSWGEHFPDYTRNNIDATQRLLEAARQRQVARIVYASSSSVYGNAPLPMHEDGPLCPISPYGVTKLTAEQLCHVYWLNFGLEVVPLRFFTVYGPRQRPDMAFHRFIQAVASGLPVDVYGDGTQRRDFTFVDDVVRVLLAAADRAEPGRSYNVAGGSTTALHDVLDMLEGMIGQPALVNARPPLPGDARDTQASTERLAALGVPVRIPIEEGLRRQVAWQLALTGDRPRRTRTPARLTSTGEAGRRAIVLYSHDTYGLGHLRRNLGLAHALVRRDASARVVIVSGSRIAGEWRLPDNVSLVHLPPAVKVGVDEYRAVHERSLRGVVAERCRLIVSTLLRVRPDVFLVDHAPLGMKGELIRPLETLRDQLPSTRVVLGLRDILDEPSVVRAVWREHRVHDALDAFYDDILVYGCRHLFDVTHHYGITDPIRDRTTFAGYVAKDRSVEPRISGATAWPRARRSSDLRVLVMSGGGGDAAVLFHRFLEAWPALRRAMDCHALLVTGPFMDQSELAVIRTRAAQLEHVEVLRFSQSVLSLVESAHLVVSMGGYNSVVEVISARKPTLICPRVAPRREQLLRAQIMTAQGVAHSHRLDQGDAAGLVEAVLATWAAGPPTLEAWKAVDLQGAERVAEALLGTGVCA